MKFNSLVNKVLGKNDIHLGLKYGCCNAENRKKYHYINSPTGLCAIFVMEDSSSKKLYHIFTDHLGSLTEIVDDSTSTVSKQSFDAWGNPRSVTDWRNTATYTLFADRGFTGHEHLEEFDLINMNGRVYDPVLGRFLSPDTYVQQPDFSQSFNRYSYCLNNPLKYTDPSGMGVEDGVGPIYNERWFRVKHRNLDTDGGGIGGYWYDWDSHEYKNSGGQVVWSAEVYCNFILPNSTKLDHKVYQADDGNTKLTIDCWDGRNLPDYGEFLIEFRIEGDQFTQYNAIQSLLINGSWILDDRALGDHGFYYKRYWRDFYHEEYYRKNSDQFFMDFTNTRTDYQTTFCGVREYTWEPIITISWGYSIGNNGRMDFYIHKTEPEPGNLENINNTLDYWNHHHF